MTATRSFAQILVLAFLVSILFPSDALAYLDPGTGSLFVQSVIATLAAVGYALRLHWGRIRVWFLRTSSPRLEPHGSGDGPPVESAD